MASRGRDWFGVGIVAAALAVVTTPAGGGEPLRVLIVADTAPDPALIERIRGQTSDLDLALVAPSALAPPDFSAPPGARAIATGVELRADVVVWFERDDPGRDAIRVCVAELRNHLGDPAGALRLYRAAGASGALTAEALFGAARCHGALGDAASEAASLRQLVASNPGSLHRRRAEERLRELSARPSNHPGSSPEEEP